MIVRTLDEITGTDRDVITPSWRSKRIVLAGDGVGFSLHETILDAGSVNDMWYANHIEAVFVVEGEGELYDKDNDVTYQLKPGSMYLLDGHEHHQLRPRTQLRTVCVFNPPVTGREVHDENGVYPLITLDELASREDGTEDELASRKDGTVDELDGGTDGDVEGGTARVAS